MNEKLKAKKMSTVYEQPAGCFSSGIQEIKACSKTKQPVIILGLILIQKIQLLLREYPSTEWSAALIGESEMTETQQEITIRDMVIFEQKVTSTTVEGTNDVHNSIGIIHSHHDMGIFFSHTDNSGGNMNNDVSIVVAHSTTAQNRLFDALATVRTKTPCGSYIRFDKVEMTVDTLTPCEKFEPTEWVKLAKEKIKESVPVVSSFYDYLHYQDRDYLDYFGKGGAPKLLKPIEPITPPKPVQSVDTDNDRTGYDEHYDAVYDPEGFDQYGFDSGGEDIYGYTLWDYLGAGMTLYEISADRDSYIEEDEEDDFTYLENFD